MKQYPDWLLEIATFETDKKFESSPPRLKKLKPLNPCEACGKELEETRIVISTVRKMPIEHLQQKCQACGYYENPYNPGEFMPNIEYRLVLEAEKKKKDK